MFPVVLVNVQICTVRHCCKNFPLLQKRTLASMQVKPHLIKKHLLANVRIYSDSTRNSAWRSKSIIPNVIDQMPPGKLTISYPSLSITEGIMAQPMQTKEPPKVTWQPSQPKQFFTLCMTNPTAQKPEWIHWLVVNIPDTNIEKGETLVEYAGPCPPKEVPHHLFVVLLFQQPTELSFNNETKISKNQGKERTKFNVKGFTKKYNINKLFAGTFFEARYDDSVREIWKSLGYSNIK